MHIGEQTNRISEETKSSYPLISWQKIKQFRNIVAHDYVGVDKFVVFDTIKNHLLTLRQQVQFIILESLQTGTFDQSEYLISKESNFYKHIDFNEIA